MKLNISSLIFILSIFFTNPIIAAESSCTAIYNEDNDQLYIPCLSLDFKNENYTVELSGDQSGDYVMQTFSPRIIANIDNCQAKYLLQDQKLYLPCVKVSTNNILSNSTAKWLKVYSDNEMFRLEEISSNKTQDYSISSVNNKRYSLFSFTSQRWPSNTVEWWYNPSGQLIGSTEEVVASITNAAKSWGKVSGISFSYQGTTTQNLSDSSDNKFVIGWLDRGVFLARFGNYDAFSKVWWNGTFFTDSEISLNLGSWVAGSSLLALQAILTHEFGHSLGLDHSIEEKSIMFNNPYHTYTYQLTLRQDDINAVQSLYPYSSPTVKEDVDTSPIEGDVNHTNYYFLELSSALTIDASVDYATKNGSAVAGEDFIATSGTAVIKSGETSITIPVDIIADTIAETDETFDLVISNPQGGAFPSGVTEISVTRTIINDD